MMRTLISLMVLMLAATWAAAQDTPAGEDDNGFIINLLERQLSTESRTIRLSGVNGLLSSEARVDLITISDQDGVWLQIEDSRIDWSRSALLRGRLQVDTIAAERIELRRKPLPEPDALPDPSAGVGFTVPELPVSVRIDELSVGTFVLGEEVAGTAAELSIQGRLVLADGDLESSLTIDRLDGPGGRFAVDATVDGDSGVVDVNLTASEPPDGVVANLLDIQGRPALDAAVYATGTLQDLTVELDFKADGEDLFDGRVLVAQQDGLYRFDADLAGRFRPLLPASLHQFVAGEATLAAAGRQLPGGGFAVETLDLDSGGLTLSGSVQTAADGFPQRLRLSAVLNPDGGGDPLLLPGGTTTVRSGTLELTYGEGERWTGALQVGGLDTGSLRIDAATVSMSGLAQNLADPEARRVTALIEGTADGIDGDDPAIARTLDGAVNLRVDADWTAGQPVTLTDTSLEVGTVEAVLNGQAGAEGFNGRLRIDASDLAHFAALTGRALDGALNAVVEGQVNPLTGAFELQVDGLARDLALGVAQLDPLLAGETVLQGGLARGEDGISARDFRIENPNLSLRADGIYAATGSDFAFDAQLADIGLATDQASGAVRVQANATGGVDGLTLTADVTMPQGTLQGRAVEDAVLDLIANGANAERLEGTLRGGARVGDMPVAIEGSFRLRDGVQAVRDFRIDAGATSVRLTAARGADGLIAGTAAVRSLDISQAATLALVEARGAVDATVVLSRHRGTQRLAMSGDVRGIEVAGIRIGRAGVDMTVTDLFGVPLAEGTLAAGDAEVAGFVLNDLALSSVVEDARMSVTADAAFQDGTEAALAGSLENLRPGIALELDRLRLERGALRAALIDPATVTLRGETVQLTPLVLAVGEGRLEIAGSVGEVLNLDVVLDALPLDVANAVQPDLDATGTVTGRARITGTPGNPGATFSLTARDVGAAPLAAVGVPPLGLRAEGSVADRVAQIDASARAGDKLDLDLAGTIPLDPGADGLDAVLDLRRLSLDLADAVVPDLALRGEVQGRVAVTGALARPRPEFALTGAGLTAAPAADFGLPPLDLALQGTEADGQVSLSGRLEAGDLAAIALQGTVPTDPAATGMDLRATVERLSLALAEGALPGRGLSGDVTGSITATGAPNDPQMRFDLTGAGLSATALRENALGPLALQLAGTYADMKVTLDTAAVTSPRGIRAQAAGTVPLDGGPLDLSVEGQIPLNVANIALARSGAQLDGTVTLDLSAGGRLGAPDLTGRASVSGGTFILRSMNLQLVDIGLNARFAGDRVVIEDAAGRLASGGTLSLAGSLGLDPSLPADLELQIRDGRYTDGRILNTDLNASLALQGPILGDGLLSGEVMLERTEISIPRSFGIAGGVLLEVEHRNPPRQTILTLDRADLLGGNGVEPDDGGLPLRVDLLIRSPNELFIRGRGLDAEMGGEIRLRGTLADIQPVGEISLIRGRLGILGQRFDFDEGAVTMVGNLDPRIRLVAETEASDGTLVRIVISGRATDPEISFTSSPDLPQDEVLALLIFNRNLSELSPFQIAQLASAAATLAGGGGGLVDSFRSGAGLANLDFTTDDEGDVGVRAGAYLDDNIYLDVETDSGGDSRASINLDITRSVRARASVDDEGETSIGIFFERDY
ncbi:hypothetical protein GE300_13680 [Rhodobacteraceae bacterium 2CG4]|uniref:Translocation and assembly module TamB C-terminal domain-containing protein n=1 Tax=Halovulum marinum TaxID=2662447 RepID=A0A6L5Z248_9RHOB|nr:translocation/assembly module TamB domain-containing protein [Halovulum marinum]MSU90651.1 hypothetical protein [Halovulum marinum]